MDSSKTPSRKKLVPHLLLHRRHLRDGAVAARNPPLLPHLRLSPSSRSKLDQIGVAFHRRLLPHRDDPPPPPPSCALRQIAAGSFTPSSMKRLMTPQGRSSRCARTLPRCPRRSLRLACWIASSRLGYGAGGSGRSRRCCSSILRPPSTAMRRASLI
ncbi:uncharacterized protein A4U43_C07F33600 [Asparagus officinalis]|uniref:Uncharacterized protein n=1 Tax=Asparagus officinalis TaxID=4686 RepID=A0A5P1EGR6_ASPOF|nr:uncharacterized protein A4U43_C07F33600 [Asparagus officinalis]